MYGLLHRLRDQPAIKGGFIHIPYLPEQAAAHPGQPSMAAGTVLFALELAISVALQVEHDLKVVGGATH
ncbi:Pyrrolidone-carboxylate peptidase [Serratia rubidaea]|nr:Pyrrolidone-carboxylate peptidase [Serratia rubidaea]